MRRFKIAPWPISLKVVSGLATIVLAGVTYVLIRDVPHGTQAPFAESFGRAMALLPLLIVAIALLFVVKSYEIGPRELLIHRLLWPTRLSLVGLTHAWYDPAAMCRSIRLFGNGGLYSITGLYRNRQLGRYRAFVTDPKRSVVLRLPDRTVVISPEDPELFARHLSSLFPGLETTAGEAPSPRSSAGGAGRRH
jgi:hypothetical protein